MSAFFGMPELWMKDEMGIAALQYTKHYGPGPHQSGSPQSVHGHGGEGGHDTASGLIGGKVPRSERIWQGQAEAGISSRTKQSKLETGDIGEQIALEVMEKIKGDKFDRLSLVDQNSPLDLVGDHSAVEVKAGLSTNTPNHRHWRITIGQPGVVEAALLRRMSYGDKKYFNRAKMKYAVQRKNKLARQLARQMKRSIQPYTVGLIYSKSKGKADVFVIPGFHEYLSWNQYATDQYYVGTYEIKP